MTEITGTQTQNVTTSMELSLASSFESQLQQPSRRNWKKKIIYQRERLDGTTVAVEGNLGTPFGNIAHVNDAEVQPEDLSHVQLLDNQTISFIKNGLGHFCKFGNLDQTPWQAAVTYHDSIHDPDLEIKIARVDEIFVMLRKYLNLDTRDLVNKYSNTRRYRTLVEKANGILQAQCPGLALVQQVIACLLEKCWNGQFPGIQKHRFKNRARLAYGFANQ